MFTLEDLVAVFKEKDVSKVIAKPLSENDNSKNQIYLGGSYEALQEIPHGEIIAYSALKRPNFKAKVDFSWINENGDEFIAPNTQMILYPKYPEVRLSGFLFGCKNAPSEDFKVISRDDRTGEKDGRYLFFGIRGEKVFSYVSRKGSSISIKMSEDYKETKDLFIDIPIEKKANDDALIAKLHEIYLTNPHLLVRLLADGDTLVEYTAPNAPGYTLEALFGVKPNGDSKPDYQGWELKTHSNSVVTLMTPQPDGGIHSEIGARDFVMRYGHETDDGSIYYTGIMRVAEDTPLYSAAEGKRHLEIVGYDKESKKITNVDGFIAVRENGDFIETWSFSHILSIWNRKHDQTCYVKSKRDGNMVSFGKIVILGKKTSAEYLLSALSDGIVYYDPASKISSKALKLRSQFRVKESDIPHLYKASRIIDLSKL